ncbi:MAG: NAD(P) transhydrogenase subunit alpha [Phycisphaerales bacterium]|nr:NAD(P) transhydrogenase subunit alpha [Phycisphaerales bacterium]
MVLLLLILLLAAFLGIELIHRIPSQLHTPLMSGTNAISGITIVGAIACMAIEAPAAGVLAPVAIFAAAINVVGGYVVTHRMLQMFRSSKDRANRSDA